MSFSKRKFSLLLLWEKVVLKGIKCGQVFNYPLSKKDRRDKFVKQIVELQATGGSFYRLFQFLGIYT